MTPQEINEAVVQKFGWKQRKCHFPDGGPSRLNWFDGKGENRGIHPPDYCDDIKAAWDIVEKVKSKGFKLVLVFWGDDVGKWDCQIGHVFEGMTGTGVQYFAHERHAEAAMAICLAFLKLDDTVL
jgi:ABA sandwich protein